MVYGLSAEVQVDPVEVYLAVDQIMMAKTLLSEISTAPSSKHPMTCGAPSSNQLPTGGHEITVSINKLNLMFHERKEGKMFAVSEFS